MKILDALQFSFEIIVFSASSINFNVFEGISNIFVIGLLISILFVFLSFWFGYDFVRSSQNSIVDNSNFLIEEDLIIKKNQNIIKVNSRGIGKTLKEAKDDAAINAISKVVGTYFDGKQIIKIRNRII